MFEIGDTVDVYQAHSSRRKTAFLFTGEIRDVDISNGTYYVESISPTSQHTKLWVPLWALVLVEPAIKQLIDAYDRAMKIV